MTDRDPQVPEALARVLDGWEVPPAREAFRRELCERFVAAGAEPARGEPEHLAAEIAPDLARALDAFRPEARDGLRDEVRAAFLGAGTAAAPSEAAPAPRSAVPPRAAATARRRGGSGRAGDAARRTLATGTSTGTSTAPRMARAQRTRFRTVAAVALLAAAAAVVAMVLWRTPASPWKVEARDFAAAGLVVDGVPLQPDASPAELARRLHGARELRVGSAALRVAYADVVALELEPGTVLDLTGLPEDPAHDLALAADVGTVRVATGPGFRRGDQVLEFRTTPVTVRVVGTVFGIDCYEDLVCVCCCEGKVETRTPAGERNVLEPGATQLVARTGEVRFATGVEEHQAPLRAFGAEASRLGR